MDSLIKILYESVITKIWLSTFYDSNKSSAKLLNCAYYGIIYLLVVTYFGSYNGVMGNAKAQSPTSQTEVRFHIWS